MAEMILPQKSGKRKVHSLRVDLTPMVDLGFLLITFFMLTTTLARPKAMELNMPYKGPEVETTAFPAEATMTLIPTRDHKLNYYSGQLTAPGQIMTTSVSKARGILQQKQKDVAAMPGNYSANARRLHVLIKPNSDCKYEDVVQLLDEMNINDVRYYAIVDITEEEKAMIK